MNYQQSQDKTRRIHEFLGVLLDENVTWAEHLKYIENKCAKNIGLL